MEELEHFSHDHPLILRLDHIEEDDDGEVYCYGCKRSISGPSYGCTQCMFFLHKSCAQLPHQMAHHSHPQHLLTLLPKPPSRYSNCKCDVCREAWDRFVYHCSECEFDVDIRCASVVHSIQQRIQHKCHTQHELTPLQKPALFLCDACGTKHEDISYLCTTCGFWVSQKCADSLPSTIKLSNHHHHPLTLLYSIPFSSEYRKSWFNCVICDQKVHRRNWIYHCSDSDSECRYFVHVNCATLKTTEHYKDCKTETEYKDIDLDLNKHNSVITTSNTELSKDCKAEIKVENRITLPVNESVGDLITLFIKDITLVGKYKEATEITHFSHEHTLYFSNKQIDQESYSESNLPVLNEVKNNDENCNGCARRMKNRAKKKNEVKNNDEKCNGCARRISAPFYHCVQCNFFLHECCAELPSKLHHPCHLEHPLLLTTNFHPYRCGCCYQPCNLLRYGCAACKFYLDIKCAFLPRIIRHEAHKHTLVLRPTRSQCSTCDRPYDFGFRCDPCNIQICVRCAILPGTVRHRYDEHPFILTYPPPPHPLKDQAVDDNYESYCEICEGEIDMKLWFYHCKNCDQSLHTKCISPVDWYSNVKYGITLSIEDQHQHLLTLVRSTKSNSNCSSCDDTLDEVDDCLVYECGPCNYWICFDCAIELVNK